MTGRLLAGSIVSLALIPVLTVLPAAAQAADTMLCEAQPNGAAECEAGILPAGTDVSAESTDLEMTIEIFGAPFSLVCASATVSGETTADVGDPLPGRIDSFGFVDCEDDLGRKCTVTAVEAPYESLGVADGGSPGDGELLIREGSGGGQPGAKVVCEDANVLTPDVNCTYDVDEEDEAAPGGELAVIAIEGGSEATLVADEVEFDESGEKCPGENPEMNATFQVKKPKPFLPAFKGQSVLCKVAPNAQGVCPKGEGYVGDVEGGIASGVVKLETTPTEYVQCDEATLEAEFDAKAEGSVWTLEYENEGKVECPAPGWPGGKATVVEEQPFKGSWLEYRSQGAAQGFLWLGKDPWKAALYLIWGKETTMYVPVGTHASVANGGLGPTTVSFNTVYNRVLGSGYNSFTKTLNLAIYREGGGNIYLAKSVAK